MDKVEVHIWQLPEKVGEVNKDNEYAIIHDGYTLKKIVLTKLYEYFNQDYKIDNIIKYFEDLMKTYNEQFEVKYTNLELSLDEYETLVNELTNKFESDKDRIRDVESRFIILHNDMKDLDETFKTIDIKQQNLSDTFGSFSVIITNLSSFFIGKYTEVIELYERVDDINNDIHSIKNNIKNIENKVDTVSAIIDTDVESKKNIFIKNVNAEYDKILNILDHYHHIKE